jgi:EAL domain-containing protein (putative c-di-GMP-specific phosphodiesterase class I)
MKALSSRGVRFALDDFGTGYANFDYLSDLPFHILKIDRAFLPGPGRPANVETILDGLISLGANLNLDVVVEGIETEQQRALVGGKGVRAGQGFLFGRPGPWPAA